MQEPTSYHELPLSVKKKHQGFLEKVDHNGQN